MAIECYCQDCPYHGCHFGDEGPYCNEEDCQYPDEYWVEEENIVC